jgi:hypothetical protein
MKFTVVIKYWERIGKEDNESLSEPELQCFHSTLIAVASQ